MRFPNHSMVLMKPPPIHDNKCIVCGKPAAIFFQTDVVTGNNYNERLACSESHYNKIIFLESKDK